MTGLTLINEIKALEQECADIEAYIKSQNDPLYCHKCRGVTCFRLSLTDDANGLESIICNTCYTERRREGEKVTNKSTNVKKKTNIVNK
jgi:hypothetical protein